MKNIKVTQNKIKCKVTREMIVDLKHQHGFLENEKKKINSMLHYEYKTKDQREIDIIKEFTEIDYEDNGHFIYSITKKQLRRFKIGAIEGIREFSKMKKILFHSEVVQDIERILELKLTKELTTTINKEIMEDVLKLGKK